jgi:hypothetical protein
MSRVGQLAGPARCVPKEGMSGLSEGAGEDVDMLEDFQIFDPEVMHLLDEVSDQLHASVLGTGSRAVELGDADWPGLDAFQPSWEGFDEAPRSVAGKRSRIAAAASVTTALDDPGSKTREKNRLAQARFRQKKKVRRR